MEEEKKVTMAPIDAIDGKEKPLIKIELSAYDWHILLNELEYMQRICNRDTEKCVDLWEKISSSLSGDNQVIFGSKKHRRLQPDVFRIKETNDELLKEKDKPKKKCLFDRLYDAWKNKKD